MSSIRSSKRSASPSPRRAVRGAERSRWMAEKSVVRTDNAPAPFQGAPYSQAVRYGDLLFLAGQVALKPDHDQIGGEGIEEQTEQVCENLMAILEAAGSSFEQVLNTTI